MWKAREVALIVVLAAVLGIAQVVAWAGLIYLAAAIIKAVVL